MKGVDRELDVLLRAALKEDIGTRDLTSNLIPADAVAKADAIFKTEGMLCGIHIAESLFRLADEDMRFLPVTHDGDWLEEGRACFYVEGHCKTILTVERTALNFLAHMSAVATKTHRYVKAVEGTQAKILDTRKTTPLWRKLDRYAVHVGGGVNHRSGLYDGILLKDNHWIALRGIPMASVIRRARESMSKQMKLGVEVRNLEQLAQALQEPCDYILLDNFDVEGIRQCVQLRKALKRSMPLEVSGGVTLKNVRAYAECGVERISVGSLTHTVEAMDISMNLL